MRKNMIIEKFTKTIFFLLLLLLVSPAARSSMASQLTEQPDASHINQLALRLKGSESDRISAFYELIAVGSADRKHHELNVKEELRTLLGYGIDQEELKLGFIQLLETENKVVQISKDRYRSNQETLTERYSNYYGDVILAVSTLSDQRAIHALAGAIDTGNVPVNALAAYGKEALPIVFDLLSNPDSHVRSGALFTISKMDLASLRAKDPETADRVLSRVLEGSRDLDPFVRIAAVSAMKTIDNPSVNSRLRELALHDPYRATYLSEPKYPVRDVATKVLSEKGLSR
jgi:HEAT repeat protein